MPAPAPPTAKVGGRAYCTSPVLQDLCAPQLSSNELLSLLHIKSELVLVCHSLCRANTIQDCCASRRGEHRGSCCSLGPRGPLSLLYTISPVLGAATCFSTEAQEYLFPACTASLRCCLPSTHAASHLHLSRMSSGGKAALRDRGADHSRS